MSDPTDGTRLLLTALLALWAMSFGYSFAVFALIESTGDGFTKGVNRVTQFLGWQGVAGIFAIAIFGVSRKWSRGAAVRRLGVVPLALAALLVAGILGVIAWARFG